MPSSVQHLKARVAALSRSRTSDDPDLLRARTQLKGAVIEAYVSRAIADAPPLDADQRNRIVSILGSVASQ